eukprot:SAG11_NODE_254_length_11587_cov_4.312913_15_plen_60_part_00
MDRQADNGNLATNSTKNAVQTGTDLHTQSMPDGAGTVADITEGDEDVINRPMLTIRIVS